jgi:hypothetical protein
VLNFKWNLIKDLNSNGNNKELNILDHGHIGNCTVMEIDNSLT